MRYARQVAVPGLGERGQRAISRAQVDLHGAGLAAELCALYLAGAGVGQLAVPSALIAPCRAINGQVLVLPAGEEETGSNLKLNVRTGTESFDKDFECPEVDPVDSVDLGARAARWAIARILASGADV